jgi:short-subunit dehydrogenase
VRVITVKPGFVDTKMTFGLPGMFLVAKPERVAKDICRAIRRGRSIVYTPWFWRPIMLIIRTIPEFIFKRMKL